MTLMDCAAAGCVVTVVGAAGGSAFYFAKGTLRDSSGGCRLAGGVQAVVTNGPRIRRRAACSGIVVAIQGVMVETCDVRGPWTMAVAGGAVNALSSMRRGKGAAVRSGIKGAAYGGAIWIAVSSLVRYLDS